MEEGEKKPGEGGPRSGPDRAERERALFNEISRVGKVNSTGRQLEFTLTSKINGVVVNVRELNAQREAAYLAKVSRGRARAGKTQPRETDIVINWGSK